MGATDLDGNEERFGPSRLPVRSIEGPAALRHARAALPGTRAWPGRRWCRPAGQRHAARRRL